MNNGRTGNKGRIALVVSLATNIFLIAFTLGRISVPGFMPPPFGKGGHPMMPPPGMFGEMPPPPPHGESRVHNPRRPPFFGPAALFSPEEMHSQEIQMRESFDKIHALRHDFATRLNTGSITKEDILKHFAEIDQIMEQVKIQAQRKAAEKISAMTPEEREEFAKGLTGENDKKEKDELAGKRP